MQVKSGLMALGVMATLVFAGGSTAAAESESTDKKDEAKAENVTAMVKPGDNLSAIAEANDTSYIRLFNANKSIDNPDLIFAGDKLRVPDEDEKLPNRFGELSAPEQAVAVSSAASSQPVTSGNAPRGSSSGNTYAAGWCTWYAKEMRPDLPNNLGDAGAWAANARAQGIPTGSTPRTGAIGVMAGHVAYVESVDGNKVTVSEMGWNYSQGGFNRRTVDAGTFHTYIYKS